MPSKIELAIDQTLKSCNTLKEEISKLSKSLKPRGDDYYKAIEMFYESENWIKELEAKVKSGKDAKAPGELKKTKENHPKIFARIKPLHDALDTLHAGAAQARKSEAALADAAKTIDAAAARSAMEDPTTARERLQSIHEILKSADKEISRIDTALKAFPKLPKLS